MNDGLTKPIVVGYSLKQVMEMLLPAGAAFVAGFLTFTDFREETRGELGLLKLTQDVQQQELRQVKDDVRETTQDNGEIKSKVDVIEERTKNTQEDVKEVKALLNEAVRKLSQQQR